MFTLVTILILIVSIVIHEVSHGYVADLLGDPTARLQGRLTLNPLKHLDPVGSIIVPLVTSIAGFTFGWAKPVPYNPYNLKNKRVGELLIALAGPGANIFIALVFSLIFRYITTTISATSSATLGAFIQVTIYIIIINIVLAVFNLVPLPPLDGSKILFSLLPSKYGRLRYSLEAYAPIWILVVVLLLWQIISPVVPFIFKLFTGVGF